MICEFYTNFIEADCNSIANQLGALGFTVVIFIVLFYWSLYLITKYRKGGLFGPQGCEMSK